MDRLPFVRERRVAWRSDFFSRNKREREFEEIDRDTLALMSALIGSTLERRRTRSRLRTLAYYDSLTGLPNRLFFQERLRDALAEVKGHTTQAVLYFDLDRFKDINDTLGHAMGDRFLQMVAHRLKRCAGDENLVARMGGDEFIVLLRDCADVEGVHALAASMLQAVEEPYRLEGYEQFITTSIGVSLFPQDGRDDQTLMKKADMAMYQVKETGGNGYFFYRDTLEAPLRTLPRKKKRFAAASRTNSSSLSANRRRAARSHRRRRGAGPLERSKTRTDFARRLHPRSGSERIDRRSR